jgi:hypothetical protein
MPLPRFTLRTALFSIIALCGGTIVFVYVVFQARFLILGPQITLEPTHPGRQNQHVVTLRGNAENITRLWLNDRPIYTDRDGHFKEALVLENGYTIATLKAEDRYGRIRRIEREFVFVPATLLQ